MNRDVDRIVQFIAWMGVGLFVLVAILLVIG
jgi:hypothetical protein